MSRRLTRRQFLQGAALASGAALLAACRPSPTSSSTVAPTPQPTPTYDPFRVTDPATVALAAGRPQLVEFFAYW
jgi:hypothetical protein